MAKKSITDEGQITKDCILHFFIGKRIGKGAYRHVYRMNNRLARGDQGRILR
jgi:hypothetical protein